MSSMKVVCQFPPEDTWGMLPVTAPVLTGAAPLIVKLNADEAAPPAVTETAAVPAAVTRAAGTLAFNCLALTNEVASGVWFHTTVLPEANFVPVTVSTNAALPALAALGLSEVTVGVLTMGTDTEFDVIPEATTLTEAVPALEIILAGTVAVSCVVPTKLVVSADLFQ